MCTVNIDAYAYIKNAEKLSLKIKMENVEFGICKVTFNS